MAAHLETTIKAFTKHLKEKVSKAVVSQGVKNINGWLETLEKAEFSGSKTIHGNLEKLKKHLDADELDGKAIGRLLHTLGEETVKAAKHAEGDDAEKLEELGKLLTEASSHKGE